MKIIAKAYCKSSFRWIFAYSYFAFDSVFGTIKKRGKKFKKNVK